MVSNKNLKTVSHENSRFANEEFTLIRNRIQKREEVNYMKDETHCKWKIYTTSRQVKLVFWKNTIFGSIWSGCNDLGLVKKKDQQVESDARISNYENFTIDFHAIRNKDLIDQKW